MRLKALWGMGGLGAAFATAAYLFTDQSWTQVLCKRFESLLSTNLTTVSSELYFDPITFLVTGLSIVFLFRSVALKSINGLKLKAPLFT